MFRRFRILILLLILGFLGVGTYLERATVRKWNSPIVVALYPINADGSAATAKYLASLRASDFAPTESFFGREAGEFKVALAKPIQLTLAPPLIAHPPAPPTDASVLEIMVWSLRLRWWAWQTPPQLAGPTPRIKLFLMFYDPATHSVLDHSTGLEKGRVGIVNLFATAQAAGSNQVVLAHELLHTLGATDKYDLNTTQPLYPAGFAEPEVTPRYPQRFAELMGGRVPLSPVDSRIPDSLTEVIVGPTTADEIGWLKR